eukprot:3509850-Prymnesium_polylepis.1
MRTETHTNTRAHNRGRLPGVWTRVCCGVAASSWRRTHECLTRAQSSKQAITQASKHAITQSITQSIKQSSRRKGWRRTHECLTRANSSAAWWAC